MDKFSAIGNSEAASIDQLYHTFLTNPSGVSEDWQKFFQGFEFARKNYESEDTFEGSNINKEFKVLNFINAFRKRGHLFTKTNPVRTRRKYFPTLDLENYQLSEADLDSEFQAGQEIGIGTASLRKIIEHLNQTYCHSIGAEYLFIREEDMVDWLQQKMEKARNTPDFSADEKKHIYQHLVQAVGFENSIHKKFVGQKRFSLEGAEGLIPALDRVIETGAELGINEFVIGMPHRGRLNVLANIMKKPYEHILKEFTGNEYEEGIALGDVKYHLGYSNTVISDNNKEVKLNLVPNPSHLETVSGLVEGLTHAKIVHDYDRNFNKSASILIHGDAAIASQGIVYEIIQMGQLDAFKTGGTIHLVINNQVGFTTNYLEGRSSTYCTDIAKVIKAPIFHVNGDDVEALVYVVQLAMEFRQRFHRDVFIDILCYRKYGHNEGDEPRFTQALLYKEISKHPNPRDLYAKQLVREQVLTPEEAKQRLVDFDHLFEEKFEASKKIEKVKIYPFLKEVWADYKYTEEVDLFKPVQTGISKKHFLELSQCLTELPQDMKFFRKIYKLAEDRKKMIKEDRIDWGIAELMAYASLADEGHPVRVSGQDSERGTFSHRHSSFIIEDTDQKYHPLSHVSEKQAEIKIINSPLSEYGVLGFEYGYALAHPNGLCVWEAQFGDFHNVAQVIIDQYLCSAEEKWGLKNGLVLFLPHGYEGQGPEHSSARVERFLSLCANNNMQIVNASTPANFFHLLRRQMKRNVRLPLVVFTPKSLLRHPACVSTIDEFEKGTFREVIDDDQVDIKEVRRVVLCSGKIYYDLLARKQELKVRDIALIRIEQFYPFPLEQLKNILFKYYNNMLTLFVQEEPENMGAWPFVQQQLKEFEIVPVTRLASGSPAVGLHKLHNLGQEEIIGKVFRRCDCLLQNVYCGLQCVIGKSREEILQQHHYIFED